MAGGGAFNFYGTMTLADSTVSGNTTPGNGGGINNNTNGTLMITGSTLSSNSATSTNSGIGGAIINFAALAVTNSTFADNSATAFGGGIANDGPGQLSVANSTISGNIAGFGGGVTVLPDGGLCRQPRSTVCCSGGTILPTGGRVKGPTVMLSVFCSPSRYTQGKNATASLGSEMLGLGLRGPALIVAGRSASRLLSSTWQTTFSEARINHAVHPFGGECSLAEIERVKSAARQHQAQVVLGAGGGKALDTARAAAADLDLPVVICPTVASSDALCSALSVLYTEEGVFHEYGFYRKNSDLVLVDTQVIAQGPRSAWRWPRRSDPLDRGRPHA
jgi:hypothetical protein